MASSSLLNQPHHFSIPQIDSNLKEQECLPLLKSCTNLQEFKRLHAQILKLGFFWSSFVASNLVATCALSEWGSMDYACSIFRHIEYPTSFESNAIIAGYTRSLNPKEAIFTYLEMLQIGVGPDNFTYPPLLKACALLSARKEGKQIHGHVCKLGFSEDPFVQNSLINVYGKCGLLKDSCQVFDKMEMKTIASWSAIIAAHASSGLWSECIRLFANMSREGSWRAEETTLVNVLSACAHLGALDLGKCTHGYLVRNFAGFNVVVQTCLMDMYIRCGSLEKGRCVFSRMGSEKNCKSYSAMISGLANHGCGEEALAVFERMLEEGLKPDEVTYVGVLSACGSAGLVEKGMEYFDGMRFEPTMQHYGCMVDLMGRAGLVHEALGLIMSMNMEPNDVIWRSFLSSCKVHGKVELGEIAAENLFKMKTGNAGDYIMMSDIYARAGRWEDARLTRVKMVASHGLDRVVGLSSVEIKREIHRFVSYDKSRCDFAEINEMLHQMTWQVRFEGYVPDTRQVLVDVGEEEKMERLSLHSQKVAIAFCLIRTWEGSVIRVVRNVRMCGDCHAYTKLVSVVYGREIVVRDRNMFHRFKDGGCSCKDYW